MDRARLFTSRTARWLGAFPVSLLLGFLLGIVVAVLLQRWNAFLAGVFLGVVIEQLILGVRGAIVHWQRTHPISRLLGTIAEDDDCYIYFSSFHRDLSKPNDYKLARWGGRQSSREILVAGPAFVLGEGDALALALVQSLLARVRKKPEQVKVERGEKEIDRWGVSCFCIGAHNPKTRVILEKFENPFLTFDNNYGVITSAADTTTIDEETGEAYRMGVYIEESEASEPTDYGIILKLKDQFHASEKTVVVIAGIGPAGTSGAAYFMLANFQDLSEQGEQFGVLIQVPSGYQSARRVELDAVAKYYVPISK